MPSLTTADATAVGHPPLVEALDKQQRLAAEWFGQLPAHVTGGASFDAFKWALAVK